MELLNFVAKNWFLFVALGIILGMLVGGEIWHHLQGVSYLEPLPALQIINQKDALILDLRDGAEYKTGHLPNAYHIPEKALSERLGELKKYKGKPVIICQRPGLAVANACNLLKQSGFNEVYCLKNGITAWQNANLPISKK